MQVLCLRTCFNSKAAVPYHEGRVYKINDSTRERWEEETFLQYFGDPETSEPLLVLPPRAQFVPTMGIAKDADVLANKILGDVEKKAAEILAKAEARAAEIIEDAIAASAPEKKTLVQKIKTKMTGSTEEDEAPSVDTEEAIIPSEESSEPKAG